MRGLSKRFRKIGLMLMVLLVLVVIVYIVKTYLLKVIALVRIFNEKDKGKQVEMLKDFIDKREDLQGFKWVYFKYVSMLYSQGKFKESNDYIFKNYDKLKDNYIFLDLISKNYIGLGDFNKALEYALRALEVMDKGDIKEVVVDKMSEEEYKAVLKKDRAYIDHTIASIYFKKKEYEKAIPYLEEAVQLYNMPGFKYYLAKAYYKTGKKEEALKELETEFSDPYYKSNDKAEEFYKNLFKEVYGNLDKYDEKRKRLQTLQFENKKKLILENFINPREDIEFELEILNGKKIKKSDLKGKVVFLNFWATWCRTCIEKLPEFQKLYDAWRDKKDVYLLAVTIDDEKPKKIIPKFIKGKLYTFPVAYGAKLARELNIRGLPELIVLDKNGKIAFREKLYFGNISLKRKYEIIYDKLKNGREIEGEI